MNPIVLIGILAVIIIPCLIWSSVMALWLIPGPLLFQLTMGIYLIISLRGIGVTGWLGPLSIYVFSSLISIGVFYLVGPISLPLKAVLGELEATIVLTLGISSLLFAAFFIALKRFT